MFKPPTFNPIQNFSNTINHVKNVSDLVFKGKSNYPISVKNTLSRYGNNKIVSIILNRKPLAATMNMSLNIFSGFDYLKKLKKSPYDELFHLSAILILDNGKKLIFEKVESMSLKEFSGNPLNQKGTEALQIQNIPPNITVSQLVENTKRMMGDNKFFTYNASSNNCQDFLVNMVRANIPSYQTYTNFIKQDTEFVFKNNPAFRKFANTLTSTGRVFNVLTGKGVTNEISGGSAKSNFIKHIIKTDRFDSSKMKIKSNYIKNKEKPIKTTWIEHVKQFSLNNNISYKEAMSSMECRNQWKNR